MQNLLLIQAMFMSGDDVPTKSKQVYVHRRPKRRLLRQFNRPNKNPARSNRHLFTMKDMRA